jgi:NADH:ubiquinone oxidoreductase subunit 5 (subunit L)/multisubunit Na+/H+ antiporter MnhA subunit
MKLLISRKVFYTIILVSLLLLIAAMSTAVYFYREYLKFKQTPQQSSQAEADKTIAEVGQLMVLPQDETPTVATVSDPVALHDQPFFAHASVGDKVLIYTKAERAILYSPTQHKIIEVAPISLSDSTPQPAPGTSTKSTKK